VSDAPTPPAAPRAAPRRARRRRAALHPRARRRRPGHRPLRPPGATRFPPEPNGYPHLGHVKSICLNFGLAREFGGTCNLRFDDTNPSTEDVSTSTRCGRRALAGLRPDATLYASDYFERLYEIAEGLVRREGYVDSQSEDEIREGRGTVTEPGADSPYRDRTPDENLDLLRRMRAGEFPDGAHVLRARIDMAHPNMIMRDPLLLRIRHAEHYRRGAAWVRVPALRLRARAERRARGDHALAVHARVQGQPRHLRLAGARGRRAPRAVVPDREPAAHADRVRAASSSTTRCSASASCCGSSTRGTSPGGTTRACRPSPASAAAA
jgi:hypothetical protein